MTGRSPYLNLREVADHCRLIDKDGRLRMDAARRWVIANRLPKRFCGRQILVLKDDVESALAGRPIERSSLRRIS